MTDKKDGPGKGPQSPLGAPDAAQKRPFATIDLKATEVPEPKAPPVAAPKPVQAATAEKVAAAAQAAKAGGDKAPAGAAAAASAAGAAASKGAAEAKPAAADARTGAPASAPAAPAPGSPPRSAAPAPAQPSGSGFGRMLSHLAAGIVGGIIAYAGGHEIAQMIGFEPRQSAPVTSGIAPDFAARLSVVEKQMRERLAATAEPARATPAVEAGLAKVEDLARQVGLLTEARDTLAAQTAALKDEIEKATKAASGGDGERLAKLEEQIAAMAAVASADPAKAGRLPQLAQLSGQVADLKSALDTRLTAQRRDLTQEIDQRVAAGIEAAEAAKAGAQRLDKEVAAVKSEAARTGQRIDQLKAGTDRLDEALKTVASETAGLRSTLEAYKGDVAGQLKSTAKPTDIALAVTPLQQKVAALETSVQGVVRAEEDRKSNAERIVLSLELGNLKRAMERGQKYAGELAEVKKVAGSRVDLSALERYQNEGVQTVADLQRSFRTIANAILDADAEQADASVVDRLLSGAKTVVRVRKTTASADDASTEAVVARMETALKEMRLADVMAEAKKLPPKALAPAEDWLRKVDARRTIDAALASIDATLKSSLGAGPAPDAAQKGMK